MISVGREFGRVRQGELRGAEERERSKERGREGEERRGERGEERRDAPCNLARSTVELVADLEQKNAQARKVPSAPGGGGTIPRGSGLYCGACLVRRARRVVANWRLERSRTFVSMSICVCELFCAPYVLFG